jgi:hypothetical protein
MSTPPVEPRRAHLTIRPRSGWAALDLGEIWLFRALLIRKTICAGDRTGRIRAGGAPPPRGTLCALPPRALRAVLLHAVTDRGGGARGRQGGGTLRVLQQRDYLRWEVLFAEGDTVIGAFEQAVRGAIGQFVVPLMAVPRWGPARLGDDVALLVRDPLLLVA